MFQRVSNYLKLLSFLQMHRSGGGLGQPPARVLESIRVRRSYGTPILRQSDYWTRQPTGPAIARNAMTDHALYLPSTVLRRSYELARAIDHASQIRECADLLSNPELLIGELLDAYAAIESFDESELPAVCELEACASDEDAAELVLEHFYEAQEVEVIADPDFSFKTVATNVRPVSEVYPSPEGLKDGLDYIAVRPGPDTQPILGAVQSCDDTSGYALLLRALACLTELAPRSRLTQLDRGSLKGALGEDPRFELHLVLWDEHGLSDQESILCEFARDLAEAARAGMARVPALGSRIGAIRCLRMNPSEFENRLWQIWEI